jgi:hypothetical protein
MFYTVKNFEPIFWRTISMSVSIDLERPLYHGSYTEITAPDLLFGAFSFGYPAVLLRDS